MTPERYAQLKEIVLTASALPESERTVYLDGTCAGDGTLRAEAEELLAGRGRAGGAVRTGALQEAVARALESAGAEPLPERIGPYRVLGVLGEGGMGTVFRGGQDEPVVREVALKVVHGRASAEVLARFEFERRTLALMDHPGVAMLLDAGSTPDGRPWFAMELVQGAPLTIFARDAGLEARERLNLFLDVCRAVRHAHQKGIIHRDLKPSNVLVTRIGGQAAPKIIDFGIARALGEARTDPEARTRTGEIVGTIEYMSPEQARGERHRIDTRSDVYSLGVLLYELLTDRLPCDVADRPLHEALKAVAEEPPRPLRAARAGGGPARGSRSRRLDPDLDTIVLKCLEKDPDRRYSSAAELAEDLERLLSSRPILARPPSAFYQMRKLLARHRVAFAAGTAVAAALTAGVVGTSIGLVKARRQSEEARQEAAVAEQAIGFLLQVFQVSDPGEARGRSVTARELLDKGAEKVRAELASQPRVQARLMSSLGTVYLSLGLYDTSRPLLEEAIATQRRLLGADHPETLETLESLGWLHYQSTRLDDAEALLREAVDRSRALLPPDSPAVLDRRNYLAVTLWKKGRLDEARALFTENYDIQRRLFGEEHVLTMKSANNIGILYGAQGRFSEAEPLFARTLELRRKLYGNDHPMVVTAAKNLALVYDNTHRRKEGLALHEEVVAICRRIYGDEKPDTLEVMSMLAAAYAEHGRVDEGEALLRRVLEIEKRTLGPAHDKYLASLFRLSSLYATTGRLEEADRAFQETYEAYRRVLGPRARDTCLAERGLAEIRSRTGHHAEARRRAEGAFVCSREVVGPAEPMTLDMMVSWAFIEMLAGEAAAARARFSDAVRLGWRNTLTISPAWWAPLRDDPEIRAILEGLESAPSAPGT